MGPYIGTSKHKWSFWTSRRWEPLIDMLSKSSKNLSRGISGSLDLRMHHNKAREKEIPNTQNKGQSKDGQPQDNQSKPQTKKGNGKMKKDTGKWCEFHKIPWHNTDECHSKQSLVVEMKASESDPGSNSDSEPDKGSRSLMQNPVPQSLPPRSIQTNQKSRRKVSTFFTHRCG
jgi:hypothetical protein